MRHDCSIIDLSTRRKLGRSGDGRAGSTARIAADLARASARKQPDASPVVPLAIRLEDLTGISDATIENLGRAAATGLLTAEAAARLAMRHAVEVGGVSRAARPPHDRSDLGQIVDLRIIGNLFGEFAFGIGPSSSGLFVAFAPVACLDRLEELFGAARGAVCIVSGRTSRFRPTAGVFAAGRCATALKRVAGSKKWRFGNYVLLVGGAVSDRDHRRRATVTLLETAIRQGGVASLICGRRSVTSAPSDPAISGQAREALQLIELAFPGLVADPADGGKP